MPYSPLIGIPKIVDSEPTLDKYANAVTAAGGQPVPLLPTSSEEEIARQIAKCDGFIFMGGPDFHHERYHGKYHPTMKMLSEERENYFFSIAENIIKQTNKPALGVCLGCQLINVIMGGTLYEDIHSQVSSCGWHQRPPHDKTLETMHPVLLTPGTPLRVIFGCNTFCANSSHHQAIRTLGKGLTVAARADDGVIEAIVPQNGNRFLIGLQWHPERLANTLFPHARIFQALVEAARHYK